MKETLLDSLHASRGRWVPLGELLRKTSLSETQLQLELRSIHQAGYCLNYHPRYGYRLTAVPDRLLPDEIQRGLNTQIIGREILTYEEVDSTMDIADGVAEKGAREGTCIFAEVQRKGRGRGGHHWQCPKYKGVLLTAVLRPKLRMERICLLAGMVAVAVAEAVRESLGLEALIKWPNDIIIHGKKTCGILVEAETPKGKEPYFLAGIGLNVNLSKRELPRDVIHPATSLMIEKGCQIDRIALARAILQGLDKWYLYLKDGDYKSIKTRWVALSTMIGQRIRVEEKGKEYLGKVLDLSNLGGPILELDSGQRKSFRGEYLVVKEVIS